MLKEHLHIYNDAIKLALDNGRSASIHGDLAARDHYIRVFVRIALYVYKHGYSLVDFKSPLWPSFE